MAQRPTTWRVQDTAGDADVGVDAWVQVTQDQEYVGGFFAQFKGSTLSAHNADSTFVSVTMKVSTLNYYRAYSVPVMLVFVDLFADPNPRTCPIYYEWIHDKLDAMLAAAEEGAKYVTFRIPTANRLTDRLDVVPLLSAERDMRVRLDTLSRAIAGVSRAPVGPVAVSQLANNITTRGSVYLESALASSDTPWPDPVAGTIAWSLKQLSDRIVAGALDEARALRERITPTRLEDDLERAEFEYLSATLARSVGDADGAVSGFEQAHRLAPSSPRYLAAWIEVRMIAAVDQPEVVVGLLRELDSSASAMQPKIRALRVRLLTVLGRFGEAEAELQAIPTFHGAVERVVLLLTQRRFDETIATAAESQALDLGRGALFTLRILGCRARFDKVFGLRPGVTTPATGPPGLAPEDLVDLWTETYRLSQDLSNAAWPANSELVVDVLTAVAAATSKAEQGLFLVEDFLRVKPFRRELHLARLKLAALAGKFETAVNAAMQLENEDLRTVHLALLHYQAEQPRKVVDAVPKLLLVPFEVDELVPDALAVAAHSARRTFNTEAETLCLARLGEGGFGDRIAIARHVAARRTTDDARTEAKQQLMAAYFKYQNSSALQAHVVRALDPTDDQDAPQLLDVLAAVASRRQLLAEEASVRARALSTLDRSSEALEVITAARIRFPDDPNLLAYEALICEKLGDTARARALLEQVLDSSEFARSIYINIAARSGLLDDAAGQLRAMVASAKNSRQRKESLHALISVELYRRARSTELQPLVLEFGALVDQSSEEEEGSFLQIALVSGIVSQEPLPEEGQAELQRRAAAYLERFPQSQVFGALPLPNEGGAEALAKAIRERFGASLADAPAVARLREQVKRGDAFAPFSWRPRVLVPAARSLAQLWELTKRFGHSNALLTFAVDQSIRPLKDLRRESRTPLIDTLSLLIISDLDLWPTVFKLFQRVAISKETLLRIQHDDGPLDEPSMALVKLREAIREYFDRIEQPGEVVSEAVGGRDATLQEGKRLMSAGRYLFYSDDVVSRVYALGESREAEDGFTTMQLLRNAEQIGDLSAADVGRKLAQLIRWNVGFLTIEDRYILRCLPPGVLQSSHLVGKIRALYDDQDYQAIISGVWDPSKAYNDLLGHIVRLLAFIVHYNPDIDDRVLAAVWASWLDKVAVRPGTPLSIEQHLATVLILASFALKESGSGVRRMWGAFLALVERHYGAQMDEERERAARRAVGRTIAAVANSREDLRDRANDLLDAVRRGLTPGTADDDHVLEGYGEGRGEAFATRH